jgi:hypothetical protein
MLPLQILFWQNWDAPSLKIIRLKTGALDPCYEGKSNLRVAKKIVGWVEALRNPTS